MTDSNDTAAQLNADQQFNIEKIFIKDMSFESPNAPAVFTEDWKPEINLQVSSAAKAIAENVYEVVLSVTVTANQGGKTAYLVEVHQGGIFRAGGFDDAQMGQMIGAFCPNLLYPFAREAIADLMGKGGFPPVYLAPVNFEALYAQKMNEKQASESGQEQAAH